MHSLTATRMMTTQEKQAERSSATKPAGMTHREKKQAAMTASIARQAGMAFLQADTDGNGSLTFDEFKDCYMRLKKLGSVVEEDALQTLFSEMDADGSGEISMDEYFIWSLSVAGQNGGGLEAVFKKYDRDGTGLLDSIEFSLAVEDLGFAATFASEIFLELDEDNSGTITYAEILDTLRSRVGCFSTGTKKFIASIAFQPVARDEESEGESELETIKRVDTSSWQLPGPDEESLRRQIHNELVRCSLRDSDLYNVIAVPLSCDTVTKALITQTVFVDAIERLGYTGPRVMLNTVFKVLDVDDDGVIGQKEMNDWMTGKMGRLLKAREAHFMSGRTDGLSLQTLEWTPASLRREIVDMLKRLDLAPLDLVRAWDRSSRGRSDGFSRREFLTMMKRIVRPSNESTNLLWYDTIRPLIELLFSQVSGKDETVDVIEFVRWLNEEYRNQLVSAREAAHPHAEEQKSPEPVQLLDLKAELQVAVGTASSKGTTALSSTPSVSTSELFSIDQLFFQQPITSVPTGPMSCPPLSPSRRAMRWSHDEDTKPAGTPPQVRRSSTSEPHSPVRPLTAGAARAGMTPAPGFARLGRMRGVQALTTAQLRASQGKTPREDSTVSPRSLRIRGCVETLKDDVKLLLPGRENR